MSENKKETYERMVAVLRHDNSLTKTFNLCDGSNEDSDSIDYVLPKPFVKLLKKFSKFSLNATAIEWLDSVYFINFPSPFPEEIESVADLLVSSIDNANLYKIDFYYYPEMKSYILEIRFKKFPDATENEKIFEELDIYYNVNREIKMLYKIIDDVEKKHKKALKKKSPSCNKCKKCKYKKASKNKK